MTIVTETYDNEFQQSRETLIDNATACRLRLTAVTNAADTALSILNDLLLDLPAELVKATFDDDRIDVDKIRHNLATAIRVARGEPDKLPRELFSHSINRPELIRAGERLGLL